MKKWQKEHHHHHHQRLAALVIQYEHLTLEQRLEAFERDVKVLAETFPSAGAKDRAARILDRIADRLKHY